MKKINFTNSRGLNLVGHLHKTDSNSVIIMSHGFTGDKSEWGRFDKAAYAFREAGYNVLNFDFSGSGESDDDSLTVDKQVDDLESAIKYCLNNDLPNIGLLGLSLGGLISAKVYDQQIKTMVFWAPVTSNIDYAESSRFTQEQIQELKDKGYLTKIREKGVRKKIIIDKQMLIDREDVNQESLLSKISCPVLIIHGDKDNRVPLKDSVSAMKYLSSESNLEIVKGADHGFYEQLNDFIFLSVNWFDKYLK